MLHRVAYIPASIRRPRRAPSEKALAKKLRELDLLNRVRLAEWLEYKAQQAPRPDTTTTAGDRT